MERDVVDNGNEEQRPMGAALGLRDIATVVYRQEDVGSLGEVGKGFAKGARVGSLKNHEGHAGTEQDDIGGLVF